MVYKWNVPGFYSVSAQDAGEELHRIYSARGKLEPSDVVDESRSESAPLHSCFEWNDEVAAEKYRETQASCIIRSIVAVNDEQKEPQSVRAFVHVQSSYQPISVVVNDEEKMAELLASALRELQSFRKKYANLEALASVMKAIDKVSA